MPKIEKDLLKVKGSDGQWHYVPAVGGEGGSTPTWELVQNKPFEFLGDGLSVENGVLSAKGGTGGSANAVQYVAQELTDAQRKQARENIGAKATTEKSAYIISKTRSYGYIHTSGMDFDGVYALIQSGKVVMLLVDNSATYYGVITTVTDKAIMFYNIRDMSQSDVGGRNKGITYFGFTWHKGDDSLTEWWGDIPSVDIDETLTKSGSAADSKAVGDALQNYVPAEEFEKLLNGIGKAFDTKLDKNQGTDNAGKILGISEDGNVVPQDKPTYTLPQATADALGGIKADAATAEDTQDVRIGADGKMKTKPYALTDADKTAVAEEVVADGVAATLVDIPTGGGGKVWKKLAEITLEADAKSVIVSQTDDGGEFAVDELYVCTNATNIEANTAKGRLSIKANDNTIALLGTSSPAGIDFGAYGKTGRNWLYLKSVNPLILLHGRWIETNTMDLKEVCCWQPNIFAQDVNLPALNEAIAKVELYCVTSTSTFTSGSKFIIWGR